MFSHWFYTSALTILQFFPAITNQDKKSSFELTPIVINIRPEGERYPMMVTQSNHKIVLQHLEVGAEYEFFISESRFGLPKTELLHQGKSIVFPNTFKAVSNIDTLELKLNAPSNFNENYYLSYGKIGVKTTPKAIKKANNTAAKSPLAPISTNDGGSITDLIKQVLIGTDCFEVTNVTVTGPNTRWGTFANGATSIGISNGVVMSSGFISNIGQPSNNLATGIMTGSVNDPVLGNLNDPVVIEFDIKPTTPILSFDYVFASEEYCQYVNQFNDAFGFYISGPGIAGVYNMAQVNGVNVSINNVNQNVNSAFYYSNKIPTSGFPLPGCTGHPMGPTTPNPAASVNECVFNGFTHILTATSPTLQTCQTYHIRLVIGDKGDRAFDSGVFLQAGSFNADVYVIPSIYNANNTTSNEVNEGCDNGVLKICRPPGADNTVPKVVTWSFTGSTATSGVDYTAFGTSATIPAGQDCIEIQIPITLDQVPEGNEIIKVTVNEGCKCAPYELVIKDPPLVVSLADITACPNSTVNLTPSVTGGFPTYNYTWSPSGSGSTNSFNAGAGPSVTNYNLTVTDMCGHYKTTITKVTVPEIPTANMTTTSGSLCAGGNTTLSVNFTGTGPWQLTYTFNGAPQPPITVNTTPYNITVTQPGTYALTNVKYTGSSCNGPVMGSAVVQQSNPNPSISKVDVKCFGMNDGSVSITGVTGGVAPYTYIWSANAGGATSATASNLGPGIYTVTVTDNIGCKSTQTASVSQPPKLVATTTASTAQTCVSQGTANVNVTGGSPVYTFLWSNGSTSQNLGNAPAGNYILTVTDSKGCVDTATVTINPDTTPPTAQATVNLTVNCANPIVAISGVGSSTGSNFAYNWSGPGLGGGGSTLSPTVTAGGTYILTVTNTSNGCTKTASVNVSEDKTLPTATTNTPPQINCTNTTISISGVGSSTGSNFTYNWSGAGITGGGTTLTPTVNAPGTYTITVTDTNNGCTKTATVNVTEDKVLPNADAGPDKILNCYNNQSVSIGGNSSSGGNFTYSWDNGNSSSTQTITTPGTYTLTVTNTTNGCTKVDVVSVTSDITPPVMNPIPSVTVNCFTPNPTLNTTTTGSNLVYTWTPSGSGANPTISTGGTYTVTVTNSVNGCKDIKSVTIPEDKQDPTAVIANPAELNCFNSSSISLDPTGTSTGAEFTYNWSGPGLSSTNLTPPNVTAPGTYTLVVTNSNNGCTKNKTVTVTQNIAEPTPAAMNPQTLNCYNNGQVSIGGNATGGTNLTYLWSNGNTSSSQNITTPGTYTVTVTNADNGCKKTATVTIDENTTKPTASAGNPLVVTCGNPTVTLTGTAGNGSPLTYNWTGASITGGGNSLTPSVNAPGTYTLVVTNTTNGCTETASVNITEDKVLPTAAIAPAGQIDCNNPTVTLDASGSSSGSNFTYQWGGPNSFSNTTINPTVNAGGVYTITVTNTTNGCTKTANLNVVEDKNLPNAVAGNPQVLNCYNPTLVLNGAGSSTGANFSYNWSATNGGNITGGATTLTPSIDKPGTYTITVTNASNGCSKTAQVNITEDKAPPVANVTGSGTITCFVPNINLGVNITSGTNLGFQWAATPGNIVGNTTSQSVTVNAGGTYIVTITNNTNGCKTTDQVVIGSDNAQPNVNATPSGTINCNNPTITLDGTSSSQGANFTYNWTGPNGFNNSSTLQPTVSVGGAYTLVISNTTNGCSNTKTVIVSEDKVVPSANFNPPGQITCANPTVTFQGFTAGNYLYSWTTSGGNIISGITSLTPTVNQAGIYSLNITNPLNGCQKSYDITVTEDKVLPTAVVANPNPLTCTQPITTISGVGSSTGFNFVYSWTANPGAVLSGNGTQQIITAVAGTYTLTLKNTQNGCEKSASATVIDNKVFPIAAAQTPAEINCSIIETEINASGSSTGAGMSYQWTSSNGGNIVSGANTLKPKINKGGTYTLIVTNNINSCTATKVVDATENVTLPTVNAGLPKLLTCSVTSVQLQGSGSTGGQYAYQWSGPGGNVPTNNGGKTLTPTVSQVGTYKLVITNTFTNCKDSSTTQVTLDSNVPIANAGTKKEIDCNIPSVQLDGSGSSQGAQFSFTWSTTNGNFTSGQTTLQPTVDKPGTYNIKVKNTQNGCEGNASVQVEDNRIKPTLAVAKPSLINCPNPIITLNGNGSSSGANFSYLWTNANSGIVSGATSLSPTVNKAGAYNLKITNAQNGCTKDTTVNVAENFNTPVPAAAPAALLTCTNPTTILDATLSTKTQNAKFQWIASAGGNIVSGATTPKPKVDNGGDYKLILTDTISLCKDSMIVKVLKDANIPTANAGATKELNCTIKNIDLQGTASSGTGITYNWTTVGGNIVSGATTLTPKIDKGGIYTLNVNNAVNQCQASSTVTITQDTILPTIAIAKPAILNCKTTVTPVDASASSQGTNFNFTWSTPTNAVVSGANSLSPLVKLPGNYSITITNSKNTCKAVNSIVVEQDIAKPQADIAKTDTLNCINLSLKLKGSASANSGFYTFLWNTPLNGIVKDGTTLEPTINQAGNYQLVVTDTVNYCASTAQVTIIKDVLTPNVDAGVGGNLTCTIKDITLKGTATNGLAKDFNYIWTTSNGNIVGATNGINILVDNPGQYFLEVINKVNGCKSKDSTNVSQDANVPKVEILTNGDLDCKTKTLVLDGSGSSQGAGITFTWTTKNGGAFVNGQNTLTPTINSAGVYVLEIKNSNNNCIKNIEKTIKIDTVKPVINVIKDILTCAKPTITLEAKIFQANNYSFGWTTSNGNILTKTDSLQIAVNKKGVYKITVKNTQNECENIYNTDVLEDKVLPIVDAGSTLEVNCQDSILTLQGDKSSKGTDFVYNWTTKDGYILSGEKTLNPKINAAGDYVLLITNKNNGCQNRDTVNIKVNKILPNITTVKPDTLTCKVLEVDVAASSTATGNAQFAWAASGNANIVSNNKNQAKVSVNRPGIYLLTVTDDKNKCKSKAQLLVPQDTVHPIVNAGVNIELDCKKPTIDVQGTAIGNNLVYQWTTTNGTIIANAKQLKVTVKSAGLYQLNATNTVNGCAADDVMEVTFLGAPKAVVAIPQVLTCAKTAVTLDSKGSDSGSNYLYTWSDTAGNTLGSAATLQVVSPGTYNFSLFNSNNSCEVKLQIPVSQDIVKPIADAGYGGTIDCEKGYVILNASKSSSGAKYAYAWSGGQISSGANTITPKVTAQAIYSLTVTNNDNGCKSEDTVSVISLKPALLEVVAKDPLCAGGLGGIEFKKVTGGTPPFRYSVDGGGNFFANIFYTNLKAGKYNAVVQDSKGCEDTMQVKITDPAKLIISLPTVYNVKIGEDVQLNATVLPDNPPVKTIIWTPDSLLSCKSCLDPIVQKPVTDMTFSLLVKNENGCEARTSTNLVLDHFIPIYIPNIFSPNDDGSNDKVIVFGNPELVVKIKSFQIFDRWGDMVYQRKDIAINGLSNGWDGTLGGKPMTPAVFVWRCEVEFIDGQTKEYKGDLTLYR